MRGQRRRRSRIPLPTGSVRRGEQRPPAAASAAPPPPTPSAGRHRGGSRRPPPDPLGDRRRHRRVRAGSSSRSSRRCSSSIRTARAIRTRSSVLICAQNVAIIALAGLVARRKGLGSLRTDFGLEVRRPAGPGSPTCRGSSLGIGLQLVALIPIGLLESALRDAARQDVVKTADRASGWQIPLLPRRRAPRPARRGAPVPGRPAAVAAAQGRARRSPCSSARSSSGWSTLRRPVGRHADRAPGDHPRSAWSRATRRRRPATCRARSCSTWASTP